MKHLAFSAAMLIGCSHRERDEVWSREGVEVQRFELVQWGTASGGIVAGKIAKRGELQRALAKRQVDLIQAKIERGILEERPVKIIRVQYTLENWEKQKHKVQRPPNGKIEQTTTMTPSQPNKPAHAVPAVIVEQLQEQRPQEVVRTPAEARVFWEAKLAEATRAASEEAAQAQAKSDAAVEQTKVSFAMLPLRLRRNTFEAPHDPQGYQGCGFCEASAQQRGAIVLHSLGGITPQPDALPDRAALERGIELREPTTIQGVDTAAPHSFDPKQGRVVLKLLAACPARVFHVKEEVKVNTGFVIGFRKRVGDADWFELAPTACASGAALRTTVTDLQSGLSASDEQALEDALRRLGSELDATEQQLRRIQAQSR